MIGSLGVPEIIFILVLALLVFGPKRLPEIGRTIGKGLAEFRRASTDLKRTINAELALEEDERPNNPVARRLTPAGTETRQGEGPQPPATILSGPSEEVVAMMASAPEPAPAAEEAAADGAAAEATAQGTPAERAEDVAAAPSSRPIEPA